MAYHLQLNFSEWHQLAHEHRIRTRDLAAATGLDHMEVIRIVTGVVPPPEAFVATCLAEYPISFGRLFVVIDGIEPRVDELVPA